MVPPSIALRLAGASERDRIITPYDADAFEHSLRTLGLLDRYPDLPDRLRHGFPIGDLPPLQQTSCPSNYPSAVENMNFIKQYASEQVALGRMTGPYTRAQVEHILDSPFITSPLSVVEKAGAPDKLRLVQDCSHRNAAGISVNMFFDSDDFPTKWGTAAVFADKVS